MRKYLVSFIFVLLICVDLSFSQQVNDSVKVITESFENFEYADVIRFSEQLLKTASGLSNDQLIEVYTMKGIAHYSFGEDGNAKKSFIEILKMDSSYALDINKTSPKIITFFNQVKKEYLKSLPKEIAEEKPPVIKIDTVFVPRIVKDIDSENKLKNSLVRSFILPGTGHLYNGTTTKGWILTSLSALSLTSIVYFVIDSNKKEKEYLQERNRNLIEDKYDSYNFSNRMKNVSFGAFAAVWLYTQLDLLFFTGNDETSEDVNLPLLKFSPDEGFELSYRINF